jgi:hypothetical protein
MMMEAIRSSEVSVLTWSTRRNIPDDGTIHTVALSVRKNTFHENINEQDYKYVRRHTRRHGQWDSPTFWAGSRTCKNVASTMPSSGVLRRVVLVRTDVSEERSASIINVTRISELGTTLAVTSNKGTLRKKY